MGKELTTASTKNWVLEFLEPTYSDEATIFSLMFWWIGL